MVFILRLKLPYKIGCAVTTHKVLLNAGLYIETPYLVKELTQSEFNKMITSLSSFVKKKEYLTLKRIGGVHKKRYQAARSMIGAHMQLTGYCI